MINMSEELSYLSDKINILKECALKSDNNVEFHNCLVEAKYFDTEAEKLAAEKRLIEILPKDKLIEVSLINNVIEINKQTIPEGVVIKVTDHDVGFSYYLTRSGQI